MARKSRKSRKYSRKKSSQKSLPSLNPHAKKELIAIACVLIALISSLSFFSLAGVAGDGIDAALSALFGFNKYIFPLVLLGIAGTLAFPNRFSSRPQTVLGIFLFLTSWGGLLNLVRFPSTDAMLIIENVSVAGGYLGLFTGYPAIALLGFWGGLITLVAVTAISLLLTFNVSLREVRERMHAISVAGLHIPFLSRFSRDADKSDHEGEADEYDEEEEKDPGFESHEMDDDYDEKDADSAKLTRAIKKKKRRSKKISIPFDLLEHKNAKPTSGDIHGRMMVIKKSLENFGVPVEMGEVSVGPTVTQFTLKPADGIKLSRILSLSNDLALSLAAHPIRIEAPIPGKSLVGIEVPNQTVAIVGLREVLDSKPFTSRDTDLSICLGKDVAGTPWVVDLAKMPHMLVAGATGSGKTVCLNSIILSLLFQNHPDDLKLILIDPKRVELPVYNGIPHLLTPAITDVTKTVNAFKWAISEMDRRFGVLSESKRRDIAAFNAAVPEEDRMPNIVIIVDELADLMVSSAAEVESSIIRIAQMARAVGIHLIVATQRPSVDVITGLIKANITSRIAFSVASSTDSRTILDSTGAEKLVGRGDMLFVSSDLTKPKRIQCCYVSDSDIRNVVDFLIEQLDEPVEYAEGITDRSKGRQPYDFGYDDAGDELYEEAKDTVIGAGKASASYLQRRLKVGYARAARLLDLLEERGIIGPGEGAKPRKILVGLEKETDEGHEYEGEI